MTDNEGPLLFSPSSIKGNVLSIEGFDNDSQLLKILLISVVHSFASASWVSGPKARSVEEVAAMISLDLGCST